MAVRRRQHLDQSAGWDAEAPAEGRDPQERRLIWSHALWRASLGYACRIAAHPRSGVWLGPVDHRGPPVNVRLGFSLNSFYFTCETPNTSVPTNGGARVWELRLRVSRPTRCAKPGAAMQSEKKWDHRSTPHEVAHAHDRGRETEAAEGAAAHGHGKTAGVRVWAGSVRTVRSSMRGGKDMKTRHMEVVNSGPLVQGREQWVIGVSRVPGGAYCWSPVSVL